ncbi:MAG: hypothetical protein Kow0069_10990 [Promethearchaeota archaeon]
MVIEVNLAVVSLDEVLNETVRVEVPPDAALSASQLVKAVNKTLGRKVVRSRSIKKGRVVVLKNGDRLQPGRAASETFSDGDVVSLLTPLMGG